jgi:phosphoribosylformimino-5-aminoimidazole carboxamide ribotide isomerase
VLIPCIDLQNGQAVQLVQGRRRELAFADVLGLLERFREYPWLHVIDLDAAMRKGHNNRLVRQLCRKVKSRRAMKLRVGGGIRTLRRAEELILLGVDQVIVGSSVFRGDILNTSFLKRLAERIGKQHVLFALDTAKGHVVIQGWRKRLSVAPVEVLTALAPYCSGFLCTDVDREGTMRGANLPWFRQLRSSTKMPIVAAGGISTKREIEALERMGIDAAVGMALYKNRVR